VPSGRNSLKTNGEKLWLGGLDSIEEQIRNPKKMVKTNPNAVNRAICGKPKTQQHWEIRNIKNRPMS
jgi:hypothetical protein